MAGLLAIFAEFEREILRERTRARLAQARQNGKRLGRPITAGLQTTEIRKLYRAGVAKAEISPPASDRPHLGPAYPGDKEEVMWRKVERCISCPRQNDGCSNRCPA
ncbi:MAG: recombinase family protein [Bryobacteraceae bacterium]